MVISQPLLPRDASSMFCGFRVSLVRSFPAFLSWRKEGLLSCHGQIYDNRTIQCLSRLLLCRRRNYYYYCILWNRRLVFIRLLCLYGWASLCWLVLTTRNELGSPPATSSSSPVWHKVKGKERMEMFKAGNDAWHLLCNHPQQEVEEWAVECREGIPFNW